MDFTTLILPSLVTFILSLMAVVPLIKWRLKESEDLNNKQEIVISDMAKLVNQSNMEREKENHRLELLIKDRDSGYIGDAMTKVANALVVVAETNNKVITLIDSQNIMISKIDKSCGKAHSRIDESIQHTEYELKDIREKYVSHRHYDGMRENKKET